MKILLYSSPSFADQNFPLVRAWQQQGHEVYYFMQLASYTLRKTCIDIKEMIPETDIIPASRYRELDKFHGYLNFKNFYIINQTNKKQIAPSTQRLFFKFSRMIKKIHPDIIFSTFCYEFADYWLWQFRNKTRFIVNDPFPHSGESSFRRSVNTSLCYHLGKKFILLNNKQVDKFASYYHVDKSKIIVSKLGTDDTMRYLAKDNEHINKPSKNVLFFGRMSPYKGIEYLCEAMKTVHDAVPEATLTIAGGGKIYFDFTTYENLDYIKLINRYVPAEELGHMLHDCAFSVCPYTDATQSGVIMTSFTMDKPVIATNVGGLGEMIDEGKTGYLIPPKDPEALADAIVKLLQDENTLMEMSQTIHHIYQEGVFSWDQIAKEYIS